MWRKMIKIKKDDDEKWIEEEEEENTKEQKPMKWKVEKDENKN